MENKKSGGPEGPEKRVVGGNIIDFASFKENRKKEKKELINGSEFIIPNFSGAVDFGYESKLPWVDIMRGMTGHEDKKRGLIKEGKTIIVMGISDEFGVLCRYNSSDDTKQGTTELRNGSLFFADPDELLFWPKLIESQKKLKERREQEIKKILGEE